MRGFRLKSFNAGVGLCTLAGLTVAWFFLSYIAFAIIGAIMLLLVPVIMSLRDGWRQTSPASLTARGSRQSPRGVSARRTPACAGKWTR